MHNLINDFPNHIEEAISIANAYPFKKTYPKFQNIVFCGMGGSGIGARLVSEWVADEIKVPVLFCQDYDLPAFVNENTLVIASSYSGNTEETLSSIQQAQIKNAHIIGVCSGGKLLEFCGVNDYDCITVPGGLPPRSALAYSMVQILRVLNQLEFINAKHISQVERARILLLDKKEEIQAVAKKLAQGLFNKNIVVYSDAKNEALAIRARQQFNENSKVLCLHHVIPEMNHNELVGWAGGDQNRAALFLANSNWNEQNLKRLDFSKKQIGEFTDSIFEINAYGKSHIEQSLYLVHLIDWCSVYLADIKNIDAVEVNIITNLKSSLA